MDFVLELVVGGLVHLVDADAGDIEFPAVINAAQTAFLVAAKEQGGSAVRAILVQQADAAFRVPKGNEVFA